MRQLETCEYSGEEIIASLGKTGEATSQQTYLTALSVSQVRREWGYKKYVCIPLTQLSDFSYEHSKPVLYALLSALFLLASAVLAVASARNYGDSFLLVTLAVSSGVVAVISFLMYIVRRTQSIVLSSLTAEIRVELDSENEAVVKRFIAHLHQQMRMAKFPGHEINGTREFSDAESSEV